MDFKQCYKIMTINKSWQYMVIGLVVFIYTMSIQYQDFKASIPVLRFEDTFGKI